MPINRRWTAEDLEKLEGLYKMGKTIYDLAEIFDRPVGGIVRQLKKLGWR